MKRTTAAMGALVVAMLVGAWIVWPSTEVASQAEAKAPTSPASASPRRPQLSNDQTSSEGTTADPPSKAPSVVVATKVDRSPPKGCALAFGEAPGCTFLEPDQETLLEMARCGIARLEAPRQPGADWGVHVFPADWVAKAGVSEAEHQRLEQAAAAFTAQHRQRWADLAASVGIERAWAETASPPVVVTRIAAEFDDDQLGAAVERVARERAGLAPNDEDVPAALEAAVRLRLDTGDALEDAIAEAVGEARAAELRAVADGWPGAHTYIGNHCEPEPIPSPERRVVPSTVAEAEACIDDIKGQGCAFLDPTQLERDRMADCGMIRFNIPAFLSDRSAEPGFGEGWADIAGLTPQEAAVLAEVSEEFREAVYRDLTELALQAGKSKGWADESPFLGLAFAIAEASGDTPEDGEAMFRRLAAEQAGRDAPPTDLSGVSLDERFTRMTMEWGDQFEQALAARLGPDRASALQHANDGWPGPRVQSDNLCNGGQTQQL
jgi:hypothetical protein